MYSPLKQPNEPRNKQLFMGVRKIFGSASLMRNHQKKKEKKEKKIHSFIIKKRLP
jgi:hypothetical protein